MNKESKEKLELILKLRSEALKDLYSACEKLDKFAQEFDINILDLDKYGGSTLMFHESESTNKILEEAERYNRVFIWRAVKPDTMQLGVSDKRVVKVLLKNPKITDLGSGIQAVFIDGYGVYEVTSGSYVGDFVREVSADIKKCKDISIIARQLKAGCEQRDKAEKVDWDEFAGLFKEMRW